jgi:hypothetical protein
MSVISNLALKIFQTEFDGDIGIMPQSYIEAWLKENIGQLNTRINTTYSGIESDLDTEAQAIYKEIYMGSYYRKQSRSALRGLIGSTNGADILNLKDGNSSVSFTNKNEVAKVYKSMADDCDKKVDKMAHLYNIYQSEPLQLGGIETTFLSTVGYDTNHNLV